VSTCSSKILPQFASLLPKVDVKFSVIVTNDWKDNGTGLSSVDMSTHIELLQKKSVYNCSNFALIDGLISNALLTKLIAFKMTSWIPVIFI